MDKVFFVAKSGDVAKAAVAGQEGRTLVKNDCMT